MSSKKGWKFLGTSLSRQPFFIQGKNVWDYKWTEIENEYADVKDSTYGLEYDFEVWEIPPGIKFAAGEFSNGVWGFYVIE